MTEMIVRDNNSLMPALSLDEAAYRYNMVVEYTKKMMTAGKDYGAIPGTKTKPTLLKPGAEKLCTLFGLVPRFEILDKITDFDNGLFYFQYLCKLEKDGRVIGTGIGSCNSKEKKYRWRYVMQWDATDTDKENAVEVINFKAKNGKTYTKYKFENTEPFELVNTIDKMAQKRSLVAATLIATNASEFFTQDIEDLDIIEGDFTHVEEQTEEPEMVERAIKDAGPVLPTNGHHDFKTRPYDGETLKAALAKKAEKYQGYDASDKQRNLLGALLSEYFQDDTKRYATSRWLFGAASTKDIDGAMVKSALDWLSPEKDDGGGYAIDSIAKTELGTAHTASLEADGQQALL